MINTGDTVIGTVAPGITVVALVVATDTTPQVSVTIPVAQPMVTATWLGTPPLFKPSAITGLTIWLDASKLAVADGGAVSPWPDLSGNGQDGVVRSSPAPVLRAHALNGLPVVRLTYDEGVYRWDANGIDSDFTITYVARIWDVSADGRVLSGEIPPANTLYGWVTGNMDVGYANGYLDTFEVPQTTDWIMYTVSQDAVEGIPRMYKDGSFLGGDAVLNGDFQGTLAVSGYDPGGDGDQTTNCEIAELVIYDRQLSDDDRQTVEQYLMSKWGL